MLSEDPELLLLETEEHMEKAVAVAAEHLAKIRTGRASAGMLEDVKVDYYGTPTPLKKLANMGVPEPRTILITPFDPASLSAIEKAIHQSGLGLTPNLSGEGKSKIIRVFVPELSEERRRDLTKVARQESEAGRVAVRNVRRMANDAIKAIEKDGSVPEDDLARMHDDVQKLTDRFIGRIDKLLEQKEAELLKV